MRLKLKDVVKIKYIFSETSNFKSWANSEKIDLDKFRGIVIRGGVPCGPHISFQIQDVKTGRKYTFYDHNLELAEKAGHPITKIFK